MRLDCRCRRKARLEVIPCHQVMIARFTYHKALDLPPADHPIPLGAVKPGVTCRTFAGRNFGPLDHEGVDRVPVIGSQMRHHPWSTPVTAYGENPVGTGSLEKARVGSGLDVFAIAIGTYRE